MQLYPHQLKNARRLVSAIRRDGAGIDASDTGTGKSFTAFAVAAALRRRPFVLCPLSVGPSWINKYDTLTAGLDAESVFGAAGCEWINYERARRSDYDLLGQVGRDSLVIVDEAHRVGSANSLQAQAVKRLVDAALPVLFLSATPFASPMRTRLFLHATGNCPWDNWYSILPQLGCRRNTRIAARPWMWGQSSDDIDTLKAMLQHNLVATKWTEVDGFPDVLVQPEVVHVAERTKARALADCISSNPLGQTVKERQALEALRVPAMIEMTRDLLDQGKKVLAFFNFTGPLDEYVRAVGCGKIDGKTERTERQMVHSDFQEGLANVVALNSKAGGEGIDLHGRDRVSLISPDWSAVTYKQVFGRTHRIGGSARFSNRFMLEERWKRRKFCQA